MIMRLIPKLREALPRLRRFTNEDRIYDGLSGDVLVALKELERLAQVIEVALAYEGPKGSDEMTLREKLAHLYRGDINWRPPADEGVERR